MLTPDDQQLVETAEEIASSLSHMKFGPHIVTALRFSAEAIRRLSGEVEELKAECKGKSDQIGTLYRVCNEKAALQSQLSQARELLAVYAAAADEFDRMPVKDATQWALWTHSTNIPGKQSKEITVQDVRNARTFLNTQSEPRS